LTYLYVSDNIVVLRLQYPCIIVYLQQISIHNWEGNKHMLLLSLTWTVGKLWW